MIALHSLSRFRVLLDPGKAGEQVRGKGTRAGPCSWVSLRACTKAKFLCLLGAIMFFALLLRSSFDGQLYNCCFECACLLSYSFWDGFLLCAQGQGLCGRRKMRRSMDSFLAFPDLPSCGPYRNHGSRATWAGSRATWAES